jgi:hypothetical protein
MPCCAIANAWMLTDRLDLNCNGGATLLPTFACTRTVLKLGHESESQSRSSVELDKHALCRKQPGVSEFLYENYFKFAAAIVSLVDKVRFLSLRLCAVSSSVSSKADYDGSELDRRR